MGINLHLFAHRSYPYIDNLHIYVVKRWLRHTYTHTRANCCMWTPNKHTRTWRTWEHSTYTRKRKKTYTKRMQAGKRNEKNSNIYALAHNHIRIHIRISDVSARAHFFNHTAELTNCNAMTVYIVHIYLFVFFPSKWTHIFRKHMMRIDFLLANIRVFFGANYWWCYCCCQKSCMSKAKQKVVSTITTKRMDCFTFFVRSPFR